jgi:hypothetical protein
MHFSTALIDRAKTLRSLGLAWDPKPGHYVWDENALIEKPSPFQEGVYFILDLKHFLRRSGTLEAIKESLVWLPTWHDARDILQTLGILDADVARRRVSEKAIESRDELTVLYDLIAKQLTCGQLRLEGLGDTLRVANSLKELDRNPRVKNREIDTEGRSCRKTQPRGCDISSWC